MSKITTKNCDGQLKTAIKCLLLTHFGPIIGLVKAWEVFGCDIWVIFVSSRPHKCRIYAGKSGVDETF